MKNFQGGHMLEFPPAPEIYYYFLKTEEVQKTDGGSYLLTYFSRLRFFRERLRFSCVGLTYFQGGGVQKLSEGGDNFFRRGGGE